MHTRPKFLAAFAALALMAGCASQNPVDTTMSTQGTTLVRAARVVEIRDITIRGAPDTGIGAAIGAVVGGIAGSRIGSGYGRTAASIGGTVAGGLVGRQVEQSAAGSSETELHLRFNNGEIRTYRVEADPGFRVGDTVRVITSHGETRITP